MAATYYAIPLEQMHEFLAEQGFIALEPKPGQETVYGKRVDQGKWKLTLRVYTGIVGAVSRGVGEDAIRTQLFFRRPDGEVVSIGGTKRVHRVEGWRKNLKDRLDWWLQNLPQEPCPKCGLPLALRKSGTGEFLACVGWKRDKTGCNYTRSIPKQQIAPKAPSERDYDGEGEIQRWEAGQQ